MYTLSYPTFDIVKLGITGEYLYVLCLIQNTEGTRPGGSNVYQADLTYPRSILKTSVGKKTSIGKFDFFPMKFSILVLQLKKSLYIAWACFRKHTVVVYRGRSLILSSRKHVRVKYQFEPQFYIAKLGYAGVYLFFFHIFAPKT